VLVAGGDGTVAKVARELIDRHVPLSVLPIGTANNLARTLGFTGAAAEIVASLDGEIRRSFDVGHARGACGKRYFFEGAGGGLLPDYWRQLARFVKAANKIMPASRKREMARHVTMLRRLVDGYEPVTWQLSVDGEQLTDDYLLIEAMNIRSVGPILNLAPRALSDDGCLDLVTVRERDREKFCDYLEARIEDDGVQFPFAARRFRQLRISGVKVPLHFDDKIWPKKKADLPEDGEIEIVVEPGALTVLLPSNPASA
jgi:diacylglycerol kinase (ATP)